MSSYSFTNRRRTSMCICSGCVWLIVLVIVQQCGGKENIAVSAPLERMEAELNYTSPSLELNYNSSTTVNAKAMEQLYFVTNFFLDLILKEEIYPEGFFEDQNGSFTDKNVTTQYMKLVRHYAGVVSVAGVGLLFVVLMPFVALFFCCCRCAGRCGGRTQPFEKRRDPCRRISLGIILSAVAIIMLFGVVCAFVTNEYMEDGIKTLPSKLNIAINDVLLFKDNTLNEMNSLLVDNFQQLRHSLQGDLASASADLTDRLKNISALVALDGLMRFADELSGITADVNKIQDLTQELRTNAVAVNESLVKIKDRLSAQLQNCLENSYCLKTYQQVTEMNNPADFSQFLDRYLPKLPNITEQISDLNSISDIERGILDGKQAYENIQRDINDTIKKTSPDVLTNLDNAGKEVKARSEDINNMLNKEISFLVERNIQPNVKELDRYIKMYSQYRYYADIAVSSVMLLVFLCITLGLFYGFCGKRPDSGYDDDCCNKATGASFLMLGVYVMFIFSAVLMIITLAHFLLGVVGEKVICQTLHHPEDSQLLALVENDKHVYTGYTFNGSAVDLNISSVISSCHANSSIYDLLQLSKAFNLEELLEYPTKYGIQDKIDELKKNINISVEFELMNDTTKQKLIDLGTSSLNLTSLNDVLSSVGRNNSLLDLARSLNDTADNVSLSSPVIAKELRSDSEMLRRLQMETIEDMMQSADELNDTAHALQEKMKFGYSSVSEAVNNTIMEIEKAQAYLKSNNSTEDMSKLVENFANKTLEKVFGYLRHVVTGITNDVGSCGPISRVYNASLVATCNDILDPFNGFWASIGWILVLFIPAIILSIKLASLYRKSESYHEAIRDTEYLYDAYADRDNIPLANGPDKKNHHRRYNETYDNSSGYMGDYSSHMGRSDRERRERGSTAYHPEDTRYNDMAPKYTPLGHWDYSNGAVPRYHSPPLSTEYERPPPYYYPGPGDSGRR